MLDVSANNPTANNTLEGSSSVAQAPKQPTREGRDNQNERMDQNKTGRWQDVPNLLYINRTFHMTNSTVAL